MAKRKQWDTRLVLLASAILFIGLVALSSASVAVGISRFNDAYFFIKRQILFGVIPGLLVFLIVQKISVEYFERYAGTLYMISLILLFALFIPGLGQEFTTGAKSWLSLGAASFQPAEIAKLALILFMASWLARNQDHVSDFKSGFIPAFVLGAIPVILVVLQPDIGTAAILFSILIAALYFGSTKLSHTGLVLVVGMILFIASIVAAPYRAARLAIFLHPELDPAGIGYHINQASLAIGSGGIFGLGLGASRQKFQYLPEVHADSIFAVMAEELGFVVVALFLILLLSLILRLLELARNARTPFTRIYIGAVAVWFASQVLLNIGAMIGLLPLTGVPLPLVSHGGTAMLVWITTLGIVTRMSKEISV